MKVESKIKMDHEPDLSRLAALAEGSLDAADRDGVLSHLAGCRECRDVLGALAEESPAIAAAPAWWRRPAAWLPVAATIAIASVVSLLIVRDRAVLTPKPLEPAPPPAIDRTAPPGGSGDAPASPGTGQAHGPAAGATQPNDVLRKRSGATRQVGSKTFQLVAGEWIDSAYDVGALLPSIDVASDDARRDLLARTPALAPYAALGERFTVVYGGTVYRFGARPR